MLQTLPVLVWEPIIQQTCQCSRKSTGTHQGFSNRIQIVCKFGTLVNSKQRVEAAMKFWVSVPNPDSCKPPTRQYRNRLWAWRFWARTHYDGSMWKINVWSFSHWQNWYSDVCPNQRSILVHNWQFQPGRSQRQNAKGQQVFCPRLFVPGWYSLHGTIPVRLKIKQQIRISHVHVTLSVWHCSNLRMPLHHLVQWLQRKGTTPVNGVHYWLGVHPEAFETLLSLQKSRRYQCWSGPCLSSCSRNPWLGHLKGSWTEMLNQHGTRPS